MQTRESNGGVIWVSITPEMLYVVGGKSLGAIYKPVIAINELFFWWRANSSSPRNDLAIKFHLCYRRKFSSWAEKQKITKDGIFNSSGIRPPNPNCNRSNRSILRIYNGKMTSETFLNTFALSGQIMPSSWAMILIDVTKGFKYKQDWQKGYFIKQVNNI